MLDSLITVFITNYNYGRYIRQAIESVLGQSLQNFELLIIDDGSTDNSKEVIESYADHDRVTIIYQKNKGLNITNNIALRLSKSKYIMRLDADDYLADTALESMVELLEKDDTLGMVFPDYYLVDANNTETAEVRRHDFKTDVQLLDQPAHGACTVIRTSYLKSVGGYDESYSCQDGYELWIKFIAKFKVTNIGKLLFYYRQHGDNLTGNENRILDTRRNINGNFIKNNNIENPETVGIIPVRGTRIRGEMLAFKKIGGKYLLDIKLERTLQSKGLKRIVITSSVNEIKEHIHQNYANNDRIIFVERSAAQARYNVSLAGTIDQIISHESLKKYQIEAFMILPIEYVFLGGNVIDDAINVLSIFNADSLISVRPEYSTFYQHHGNGMTKIMNQSEYTRLEREAIYKSVGGIHLTKIDSYKKEKSTLPGKVGHIVVDQKEAHGIFSSFDLEIAELLMNKENRILKV